MKQNKLNFICVMTLTMTSGFLMAPAVEGKTVTIPARTSSGKFEAPSTQITSQASINSTMAAKFAQLMQQQGNPVIGINAVANLQKPNPGAAANSSTKASETNNSSPTFSSRAKAATISAAEAAKQAAITAAKAVYNVPGKAVNYLSGGTLDGKFITGETGSLRSATNYNNYNWNANKPNQTGWNFTTLANENYNRTTSTYMKDAGLTLETQGQHRGMPVWRPENKNSSITIDNSPTITATPARSTTSSSGAPSAEQNQSQSSSAALSADLQFKKNKAELLNNNNNTAKTSQLSSATTQQIKSSSVISNPVFISGTMTIAGTNNKASFGTTAAQPIKSQNKPTESSAEQLQIAQPTQKIQNKPAAPDYDAALGDSRPLRSLFAQPEIAPQIKVPTIELSQDRSRTITSATKSAAAINKARVDAKNQARFSEQPAPVETPVQKQQAQESLVIQPTLKIENKPQQSQETQQNQVAIIPGEGVRDIALQQNFRQLNLKSVQNGQAEIAQKNQGQANQQAISPIDKDFKHDYIYTKTAEATIPYPTKRYTGNEHLKNYAERSRAEILNKKEAQEAAIIHDVTPKYENIYPDNTKYTAKQTFEEQQKTPSQTPAATEFIGSQIRNKNPLEYHQKTITNQEIVSKKSQKSESTIEIETLTPEKVRKMSDYELYFLLDDAIARIDTDTLALEYLTPEQIFQPKIDKQVILQEIEIRKGQNKPTEPQETQSQKSEPATESFTDYETLTPEKVRTMSTEDLKLMLDFANATIKTDALIPLEHLTADQRIVPGIDKHVILQELQNRLHDQIKNVGSKNLKPIDLQSINKLQ